MPPDLQTPLEHRIDASFVGNRVLLASPAGGEYEYAGRRLQLFAPGQSGFKEVYYDLSLEFAISSMLPLDSERVLVGDSFGEHNIVLDFTGDRETPELGHDFQLKLLDENKTHRSVSPNGLHLAVSKGRSARVWNLLTGEEIGEVRLRGIPDALGFSGDSKSLRTLQRGMNRGDPVVFTDYDIKSGAVRAQRLRKIHRDAYFLESPDLSGFATFRGEDFGRRTKIVLEAKDRRSEFFVNGSAEMRSFSPDGRYLFVGHWRLGSDGQVQGNFLSVIDTEKRAQIADVCLNRVKSEEHGWRHTDANYAAVSPDGKQLLVGRNDGAVAIWPLEDARNALVTFGIPPSLPERVSVFIPRVSADFKTLIMISKRAVNRHGWEERMRVWDLQRVLREASMLN